MVSVVYGKTGDTTAAPFFIKMLVYMIKCHTKIDKKYMEEYNFIVITIKK